MYPINREFYNQCPGFDVIVFELEHISDVYVRRSLCKLAASFGSDAFFQASSSLALIASSSLDLRCSRLAPTLCSIALGPRSSVFPCTLRPRFAVLVFGLCFCTRVVVYLRFRFVFSSRLALSGLGSRSLFSARAFVVVSWGLVA